MGRAQRNPSIVVSTLAKTPAKFLYIARPIRGINAELHHAVKRRMGPVGHSCHKTMLQRIDVDMIDVTHEVVLIANGVLPIAALPDSALALGGSAG